MALSAAAASSAALPAPAKAQELTDARRVRVARRLERSTVRVRSGRSTGSGFVVGPERWVVTNAHVLRSPRVRIRFAEGEVRPGRLAALDRPHDLAVIHVRGEVPAPALPLADSDGVRVGQTVLAFGSPFGLQGTLTQGIVSARRTWRRIPNVIQTDASINPGSSGGPLVDARGRVVGVNTAILSRSGGNHGISFAVPSNALREVLARAEQADAQSRAQARAPERQHEQACPCRRRRAPRSRCR